MFLPDYRVTLFSCLFSAMAAVQQPQTIQGVIYSFGSGAAAPAFMLSNFYKCDLALTADLFDARVLAQFPILRARFEEQSQLLFDSTEAAWQALKAANLATFVRFEQGGDLGSLTGVRSFFPFVSKNPKKGTQMDLAVKKHQYWMGRYAVGDVRNKLAVGIIPKMAVKNVGPRWRRLGIAATDMVPANEWLMPEIEALVWKPLLHAKLKQNPKIWALAASHASEYFLEFDRSAKRLDEAGGTHRVYWGGMVDAKTRQLYGSNRMGVLLKEVVIEITTGREPSVAC